MRADKRCLCGINFYSSSNIFVTMLPEAKDSYAKAARYHLMEANKNFSNKSYGVAFRASQEYAENVIKATLEKKKLLTPKDKKHRCWDYWERIKISGIMSASEITTLDIMLRDLLSVNVSSQTNHVDCAPTGNLQTGRMRYLDADEYVTENDAKIKVDLANQTWMIFSNYI